jgi:hypothetical protein
MAVSEGTQPLYVAIADLPDGIIRVNLLDRTASLGAVPLAPNRGIDRLAEWLRIQAGHSRGLTYASLVEAQLEITADSRSIPTLRSHLLHFVAASTARLRTAKRAVEASARPRHVWINRLYVA